MSTVHDLKCWPEPFQALLDGTKTAEWRECRDRNFQEGDTLHMREWDPAVTMQSIDEGKPGAKGYTGRTLDLLVTHIISGPAFGIPEGYCMMSVRRVSSIEAAAPDMLDALVELTDCLSGSVESMQNLRNAHSKAIAAIAKARGQSPQGGR